MLIISRTHRDYKNLFEKGFILLVFLLQTFIFLYKNQLDLQPSHLGLSIECLSPAPPSLWL